MSALPKKILVPVDGSEHALHALDFAIGLAKAAAGARIELVNVQVPVGQAVSMFVASAEIKGYHREEGMKVLGPAIEAAKKSSVPFAHHIGVGQPGVTIAAFAEQLGCDHIVMGTRGLGAAARFVLGSCASEVAHESKVSITLVK